MSDIQSKPSWFKEEDPTTLIKHLGKKADNFTQRMQANQFIQKVIRNWLYYYDLFYPDTIDYLSQDVKPLGDYGEIAAISINHHRSILQGLLSLATSDEISLKGIASNSDVAAMESARLATNLLEYYMKERSGRNFLRRAAEQALVLSAGYVKTTWEPTIGNVYSYDPETGTPNYEGDLLFENPTLFDVIYDPSIKDWSDNKWVLVRTQKNKFDLCASYPELEEEIMRYSQRDTNQIAMFSLSSAHGSQSDFIDIWEFYYSKCPAMPDGRFVQFCGKTVIHDGPMIYRELPVHRMIPNELLLTNFGWSPGFSLQGIQEAINAEATTILSNHKSHGLQHIWVPTSANEPEYSEIEQGLSIIRSDQEPKGINFTTPMVDFMAFFNLLVGQAELTSGLNSSTRGRIDKDLSGTALALLDSKSLTFAQPYLHAYHQLIERVGTFMVKTLRDFGTTERVLQVVGKHNAASAKQYWVGSDLEDVENVTVETQNPLMRTDAGKLEIIKTMIQAGAVTNQEEILQLFNSGQIEPLEELDRSELNLIRDENERLLQGIQVEADPTDNHILHYREHKAKLNSIAVRNNPAARQALRAHMAEHHNYYLQMPGTQVMMGWKGAALLPAVAQAEQPMGQPPSGQPQIAGPMPQPHQAQPNIPMPVPGTGGNPPVPPNHTNLPNVPKVPITNNNQ